MKYKIYFVVLALIIIGLGFAKTVHAVVYRDISLESNRRYPYIYEVFDSRGHLLNTISSVSANRNLDLIIADAKIGFYALDKVKAFPDPKMGIGSKIKIIKTPKYFVTDGRRNLSFFSWAKTVEELFSENKIILGQDDKTNFSLKTDLVPNMDIKITRVAVTIVAEGEPIDFKTVKRDDKTLDEGKTRVEVKGEKGTKTYSYEVRREDGVEISRRLLKTEITKNPVDEVLIIGTKPVITVSCGSRSDIKGWIIEAATKHNQKANMICCLMMAESMGNANSTSSAGYSGLFQYSESYWRTASSRSGFAGSSIFDAKAQIFTTASEIARGEGNRWPPLNKCR